MPELDEISYSREGTILAFRDYYRFLVGLYVDESNIIEPPKGGWPSISPEFQQLCKKSDEVIALLRNLPYIREDCIDGEFHPPQATPTCYWADWQSVAAGAVRQAATGETDSMPADDGLKVCSEGEAWENVPFHVIGLTFGGSENKVFLLDTQLGIIHWPESNGEGDHRRNCNDDPWFIDTAYDAEDHVPENEVKWRNEAPAWAIVDFFELLKNAVSQTQLDPRQCQTSSSERLRL